jgi:translation initiation factor 4A
MTTHSTVETSLSTDRDLDIYDSFDDMGLEETILRGIYGYGFEKPSAIQKRAIVPVIKGNDIIAQAQSGTGKTATFSIGLLHRIDSSLEAPQALVIADTRELAQQIKKVVSCLAEYTDIGVKVCIGGMRSRVPYSRDNPIKEQVIVGTPGRIFDYLEKGIIPADNLKVVVIDEADKMLSKEFLTQIQSIFNFVPRSSQIGLFSATLPEPILELTSEFMVDPIKILVKTDELTLDGIKQFYILLNKEEAKFDAICDLYKTIAVTQCMIYCNSKKKVRELTERLTDNGFTVACIHGDMEQEERNKVMQDFRDASSRILVATDIVSRGIDVQQVSLVINYDIPREGDRETYIHRIGRSGRFGRKGVAINFVTFYDSAQLQELEKFYSTQIEQLPRDLETIFG